MAHLHAFVLARADAHEGDAVAVLGVHVRLDLEHEACEFLLGRLHGALVGDPRQRLRCPVDDGVQHMVDAEVAERGAEEDRGHLAAQEGVLVEFVTGALDQLQLLDEIVVHVAQVRAGFVGIELVDDPRLDAFVAMAGHEDDDPVLGQWYTPLKSR